MLGVIKGVISTAKKHPEVADRIHWSAYVTFGAINFAGDSLFNLAGFLFLFCVAMPYTQGHVDSWKGGGK